MRKSFLISSTSICMLLPVVALSACNHIALKAIYNFGWRNTDSWYHSLGYGHLRLDSSSTIVVHGIIVSNIRDGCIKNVPCIPVEHDARTGVIECIRHFMLF